MKHFRFLFISVILIGTSCTPFYIISDFDDRTNDHHQIAVLPFEMVFTGVAPEGLSATDIEEIEMAESKAFQISFTNEILRSTRSGKKPIRISVQDHTKTLNMMENAGIDIRTSWTMNAEEIAHALEVDAIVRGRIQKHRLMSDLESYGIDIATHILISFEDQLWPWIPPGLSTSKQIQSKYTLLDAKNGDVLWSVSIDQDSDWRSRSNVIIDELNRRAAKRFPYRD